MVQRAEGIRLGKGEAVTVSEHNRLRREASGLKVRAMRLRALGDDQDQWEAILHLHEAARKELAAVAEVARPSEHEQTGAQVEACGLFLEARDPVRAAVEWARLPRWAFTSENGSAMLARLMPLYTAEFSTFSEAWRKIQQKPGIAPKIQSIHVSQLRSMVTKYPGVAELWWALSKRESTEEKVQLALGRMRQLDSTLASLAVAEAAWARIEQVLASQLKLELHTERSGNILTLDLVGRIQSAFGDVLDAFAERVFGDSVQLIPRAATPGSFILDISAQGLHPYALEELDRELTSAPERVARRKLVELAELLSQNGIKIAASVINSSSGAETSAPALVIDAQRGKMLLKAAECAALRAIDSADIPQADDIKRVFLIVTMIAHHEEVNSEALEITHRQVAYYRRAGKILGLIAESDELTSAGRLIARLGADDRLRATVVYFESSTCGDAWIRWSSGKNLLGVKPETAADFLVASVPGLSKDTAHRRAKTLIAWHRDLVAYHYAR
jgi:hypothetical protein